MATLFLDNVPDKLLSELKNLAALEHLPVAEKTVQLLQQAIGSRPSTGQTLSAEEWEKELRSWAASHKLLPYVADDDRDSIYAGRGE
ncbi:MAG TPA: hypothetical protein VMF69_05370 [Gemmataceae bacterium]|nr:hypothetical protein [Gemmataceae bacterium]